MDLLDYLRKHWEPAAPSADLATPHDWPNNGAMLPIAEFSLQTSYAVATATRRARLLATLTGLPSRQAMRFTKAVTLIAELVVAAGLQRKLSFAIDQRDGRQRVVAAIHCLRSPLGFAAYFDASRPPVPAGEPPQSEQHAHFREQLVAARALVDDCDVQTGEDECVIVLAQLLPPDAVLLHESDVRHWSDLLLAGTPSKALAETQRQFRQLSAVLSSEQSQHSLVPQGHQLEVGSATFELLSRVVSDTTNSVAVIGSDGLVQWVNHAFESLTGVSASEAVGMPFETYLFGTDSDPEWVARMRRMMSEGKAVSGERMHRRHDGHQYWCTFNISPLHEPGGQVVGWVDIGWDTTASRKAREELVQARQHAEAANRAKSEFLANMSHEIRTPMNTILGMTELALGTDLTDQQVEYLGTVKDSAQSLLGILNDILDLSKIEARRFELEEIDFRLIDLLQETMRPLVHQAAKKSLELTWEVSADIPPLLRGDPMRLRQVLLNLVSNAVKFTNSGEISVSVEKQWSGGNEVGLQLSVRDTGIGIPPDRLSKIFEAFTQIDSSTTRKFGGTGLGLTITAELLRLMDGRIWVDSTVGSGSTFYGTFRLRVVTCPTHSPSRLNAHHAADHGVHPLRVLVADDHYPNRRLITEILKRRGHAYGEACNGREVLSMLARGSFDAVLIDVQMPEMDGFETTVAIRDAERATRAHMPIIAVTAYAMKGDREKCLAAGMDAYLPKPVDAGELIRLVETLANAVTETACNAALKPSEGRARAEPKSVDSLCPAAIDFSRALERLAGDTDLLRRQMSFFLTEAPRLMEQLQLASASHDAMQGKLAAHRLKGLVSSYDHLQATEISQELQRCFDTGSLTKVPALCAALARYVRELGDAMRRFAT